MPHRLQSVLIAPPALCWALQLVPFLPLRRPGAFGPPQRQPRRDRRHRAPGQLGMQPRAVDATHQAPTRQRRDRTKRPTPSMATQHTETLCHHDRARGPPNPAPCARRSRQNGHDNAHEVGSVVVIGMNPPAPCGMSRGRPGRDETPVPRGGTMKIGDAWPRRDGLT